MAPENPFAGFKPLERKDILPLPDGVNSSLDFSLEHEVLSPNQLLGLVAEIRSNRPLAREAWESLAGHCQQLVFGCAMAVTHGGHYWTTLPMDDLVQEGNFGLLKAVNKFDPRKGPFIPYAKGWVKQAITRALAGYAEAGRLPVHQANKIGKLRQQKDQGLIAGEPSRRKGLSERNTGLAFSYQLCLSLDQPGKNGTDPLGLRLPDPGSPNAEKIVQRDDLSLVVRKVVALADFPDPRMGRILSLRFPLDGEGLTQRETAEKMRMKHQRVQQLESQAMALLKRQMLAEGYGVDDLV